METGGKLRIGIFGGGITGLTVAYYLQKEIIGKGLNVEYKLYESTERLGGKIQTDYTNNFVIERGPDSFLARKESASRLAKEVGLEKELVHNDTGQSYVLKEEKLYPIPGGAVMGVPTKLAPFVSTKLFSPFGKLRAVGDIILPKTSSPDEDIALGTFFRKRLGDEVVDYLIEPLLSGIYAGDIDRLSLKATFPQFHQVEQKYGSLILGMKKAMPAPAKSTNQANKSKGIFLSFKRGLQSLVDSIETHLDEDAIHKGIGIKHVGRLENGRYEVTLTNGQKEVFDKLILNMPHQVTRTVLKDYHSVANLEQIPSTSVATIAMAFPLDKLKDHLGGTGFVVAKKGKYTITACTWTHKKWKHSAPKGYGLLRCYVGRFGDDRIVDETDEHIFTTVMSDLKRIMDIEGEPDFYRISRWRQAMPQYLVGHKERMNELQMQLRSELPGVYMGGAAYEGLGLPDCIDQGEKIVKEVLQSIE